MSTLLRRKPSYGHCCGFVVQREFSEIPRELGTLGDNNTVGRKENYKTPLRTTQRPQCSLRSPQMVASALGSSVHGKNNIELLRNRPKLQLGLLIDTEALAQERF